jgi:hypothetical protein
MSQKIIDESSGEEIEVFTAEEVQAQAAAAVAAKDAEYAPQITQLTEKLTDAEKRAQERAGEFATFRKLSDEAVAKLDVAQRTIYENGLALEEERQKRVAAETANVETLRDSVITTKANGSAELVQKMKDMWPIIGINANTREEMETKATMVLGALSTTVPDLVAVANNFSGGSYQPPVTQKKEGESFADTDAGKAAASELGLVIETPKS